MTRLRSRSTRLRSIRLIAETPPWFPGFHPLGNTVGIPVRQPDATVRFDVPDQRWLGRTVDAVVRFR
jgi:hypothetical protein